MGTVEFLSAPLVLAQGSPAAGLESAANLGAVRLGGHFAGGGTWSLGGLLAETGNTSWRVAAEFLIEPAEGHSLEAGAGFGTRDLRMGASDLEPGGLDARSLGALFVRDTWSLDERVSASAGARYSFIGFVRGRNYVDPHADVSVRPDRHTVLRASVGSRTLAPGGDLLTLSTIASSPALALAQIDEEGRAERAWRAELSADRALGRQTTIGARAFREDVRDQLMSVYEGSSDARLLRITNAGALYVRGVGVTVTQRFGRAVVGAVTYTLGHSHREGAPAGDAWATPVSYRSAGFHDLVAQVETIIDLTDTRLTAYCRWNSLAPESDAPEVHPAFQTTRFDVQLTQGLPFLHELTRAEWEVLLSVRNLSYEAAEAGTLDELAVLRAPKRLMGGVAVRF
jgi:outer membrane receptor protein involved in Fe transport